jgi:hypothetical protein
VLCLGVSNRRPLAFEYDVPRRLNAIFPLAESTAIPFRRREESISICPMGERWGLVALVSSRDGLGG